MFYGVIGLVGYADVAFTKVTLCILTEAIATTWSFRNKPLKWFLIWSYGFADLQTRNLGSYENSSLPSAHFLTGQCEWLQLLIRSSWKRQTMHSFLCYNQYSALWFIVVIDNIKDKNFEYRLVCSIQDWMFLGKEFCRCWGKKIVFTWWKCNAVLVTLSHFLMLHCNTQAATSTFDMFKAYHTLTTIFAMIFRRRQIFGTRHRA